MNPFKKEEKKPISFASVEMQKAPRNYTWWALVLVLLVTSLGSLYLFFIS